MSKAKDTRETAGRLTLLAPKLERIEGIDDRLSAIAQETRSTGGLLPPGEVAARLVQWLRARRAGFETSAPAGQRITAFTQIARLSVGKPPTFQTAAPEMAVLDLLLWLVGDELEAGVEEAVKRIRYTPGLRSEERARIKTALAAERDQLVTEREQLVDAAFAAGVEIRHLQETQQRRDSEARERELQESARQRQARVARQLDAEA